MRELSLPTLDCKRTDSASDPPPPPPPPPPFFFVAYQVFDFCALGGEGQADAALESCLDNAQCPPAPDAPFPSPPPPPSPPPSCADCVALYDPLGTGTACGGRSCEDTCAHLGQLDDAGHQWARSVLLLSNRRLWLLWKLRRVHKSLLQRAQRSALPMHADAARTAGAAGPARSTEPDRVQVHG